MPYGGGGGGVVGGGGEKATDHFDGAAIRLPDRCRIRRVFGPGVALADAPKAGDWADLTIIVAMSGPRAQYLRRSRRRLALLDEPTKRVRVMHRNLQVPRFTHSCRDRGHDQASVVRIAAAASSCHFGAGNSCTRWRRPS